MVRKILMTKVVGKPVYTYNLQIGIDIYISQANSSHLWAEGLLFYIYAFYIFQKFYNMNIMHFFKLEKRYFEQIIQGRGVFSLNSHFLKCKIKF